MPKILWMSPSSLHDTSSGAAVNCRYMLKSLQKQGFEIWACSSFIFDSKTGSKQAFGDLEQMFAQDPNMLFVFDEDNIHFVYTRCMDTQEQNMTLTESQLFFNTFVQVLEEFQPDLVIGNGSSPSALNCFAEAKHQNIATVYMLSSATYGSYLFPNIDLITTDSKATADLYAARNEINVTTIGGFFELKDIVAPKRKPRYITMINPADHKGLAIFAKLALMCQSELPELEFLVVNSRQKFNDTVVKLHTKDKVSEHPFKPKMFTNVYMVENQMDIRSIYSITKVLVVPSLWFESWGRVASEAVFNGIPVLSSNSGGLMEASGGGGIILDVPEHCKQDYNSIPSDEEIRPWLEALKRLCTEDFSEQIEAAKEQLSLKNATKHLIEIITPLIERSQALRQKQSEAKEDINKLSDAQLRDPIF